MTDTPDIVEVMAAEVAREITGWTPAFKPNAVWPNSYIEAELTTCRAAVVSALAALDAAGWAVVRKLPDHKMRCAGSTAYRSGAGVSEIFIAMLSAQKEPHPTTGEGE